MIGCKDCVDLLVDFLDGSLAPKMHDSLMRHFQDCPPCLHFVETYKKTSTLCRETLKAKAPAEMGDRLMLFLRNNARPSRGPRK